MKPKILQVSIKTDREEVLLADYDQIRNAMSFRLNTGIKTLLTSQDLQALLEVVQEGKRDGLHKPSAICFDIIARVKYG